MDGLRVKYGFWRGYSVSTLRFGMTPTRKYILNLINTIRVKKITWSPPVGFPKKYFLFNFLTTFDKQLYIEIAHY